MASREARWSWGALALCFLYAALRYGLWAPGPPRRLPVWVLNKALALSSLTALVLGIRSQLRGEAGSAQRHLEAFGCQATVHVLLSLALFTPAYFPKLFPGGVLSHLGELALLGGALGAATLAKARGGARAWLLAGLAALLLHLGALGAPAWAAVAAWPRGMPPLTLLGFLGAGLGLAWAARLSPPAGA